jgi:hypothetical protein
VCTPPRGYTRNLTLSRSKRLVLVQALLHSGSL